MQRIVYGLALFIAVPLIAQEKAPELITDRPDQTESSITVPFKTLQIETGAVFENDDNPEYSLESVIVNSTLLRYGILENLELRLGLEYQNEERSYKNIDTSSSISGVSPLYAGFKINVAKEDGWIPEIAFLGGLGLPITAHKDYKTPYNSVGMRFSFSHTLSDRVSLGYNLGVEWDGESAISTYFYSLVFGVGVTDKIGCFVEAYGFLPDEGNQRHLLDGGFTYLLLPNLQLDLAGGIGLNDEAIDNFIGFGLTWRLPR